ncbi:hypothetical protein JCGZ_21269 [Jatropha curcas]|uniref:Ubiquitin-like domain-containing protein n=1 Tax=Jatropha curcas TaxID=180498 RepID=A0A067JDI0_JATCU|nr:uncharacterized protein LOC110011063 isoform X1 [Jatropha curcas]KDP20798.1 hypothetical protein JCGZ_21269 [Jatropha curcas]
MIFWVIYLSTKYPTRNLTDPTIYDIKLEIGQLLHVEVGRQKITHDGVEVENNTLRAEDYGIRDNDEIFLSVKKAFYIEANAPAKYYLTIWDDQTILKLKREIWILTGMAVDRMELSYIQQKLDDDKKIMTYQIPDEATIDAVEMYDLEVKGSNGNYRLKVHEMMTIGQVKEKLHVDYGLDHETLTLERAYSRGFFRDDEHLSAHHYQVMTAVGGGS